MEYTYTIYAKDSIIIYIMKSLHMKALGTNNIFKNMARFLLGLSWVFFVTMAFEIVPIAPNSINFLKTIFLTSNWSNTATTGIVLEWSGGNGWFKWSLTIDSLPNVVVLGTNASGKLIASTSGAIYNFISGFSLSWPTWATGINGTSVTSWWINGGILYLQYSWVNGTWVWTLGQVQWATWAIGNTWSQWIQGIQWIQWMKWDTWVAWSAGINGSNGAIWATGNTWLQWIQWLQGIKWDTWLQWTQWNTWAKWDTWTQWLQGIQGNIWATWATWAMPDHSRSWTYLRFQNPLGWRNSFVNLIWPAGAQWTPGHITVINITQTGEFYTNGQCSSTGNVVSFYADSNDSLDYNLGDMFLWSTIICSAGWVGPQWIQGITGAKWNTGDIWPVWAKWDTWAQWLQGIQGIKWDTWTQWLQWDIWPRGNTWAQWLIWLTWPTWATGTEIEMWASANYLQRRYVWWWRINLISLTSITWPQGIQWTPGHITVINITQTGELYTNGQCSGTGNIISFYSDSNDNYVYDGGDMLLNQTIICSAWWVGPQWIQGNTWAQWLQGIQGNTWAKWDTWSQWIQGIQWNIWATGWTWATWTTWAIPNHERSWTFLRFQNPLGWRNSFVNLIWPAGAQWTPGHITVINITQTGELYTNGQCSGTGNIISFYSDSNDNYVYDGGDMLLNQTIICSAWWVGPQWIQGNTWAQWLQGIQGNTWAKWDTWSQWIQGIQWLQWIQWLIGVTWPTWATWAKWDTWSQWIQGIQWLQWIQWLIWLTWPTWATWAKWDTWSQW